jgi:hypothetical protein
LGADGAKKVGLKPGAPLPGVRLPENFVARPDALAAVKERLLVETEQTLVVSAIAGLGGLGKSVLATAVVLDAEVQARFEDGILWVTLGQNPDLQNLLGDWIRELDKSREAFSANTLEAASRYLGTLLAERRMLLVVDDVWNGAHSEWFRVGGVGCRVLVTTREARLAGADYYDLDLMSEAEAIELLRKKLGDRWRVEELAEVKAFVRVLGYLPLALDLAVNQVRDGLSWGELRSEFEAERKSIVLGTGHRSSALKLLDSSEAWELLDEDEQRKYSLQACFNLSLKRLSRERFEQFAWLGVLPEDVDLTGLVAAVLWDVPLVQAKKVLIDLRNRSFLTSGVESIKGELSYRVHDLMHDMARGAIESPRSQELNQLGGLNLMLPVAHREFLERYRNKATERRWDKLPKDNYIHRHLTWHMMRANWNDEIHGLIAMSDEHGKNAWFEACSRLGQPAIFTEDVGLAWKLAEQSYEQKPTKSIILQCRYALISATLMSITMNLSAETIAAFVKGDFWTIEQAWSFVEQMNDMRKVAEVISLLSPYLSKSTFSSVLRKTQLIEDKTSRARVLSDLARFKKDYFPVALIAARSIPDEVFRVNALIKLTDIDWSCFHEALSVAQSIRRNEDAAKALINLTKLDKSLFSLSLNAVRGIHQDKTRSICLLDLIAVVPEHASAIYEIACLIQDTLEKASVLVELARIEASYFPETVLMVKTIQQDASRQKLLTTLADIGLAPDYSSYFNANDFKEVFSGSSNEEEYLLVENFIAGVNHNSSSLLEVFNALEVIVRKEDWQRPLKTNIISLVFRLALTLVRIENIEHQLMEMMLSIARTFDEDTCIKIMVVLAEVDSFCFSQVLMEVRMVKFSYRKAKALCDLARIDNSCAVEAFNASLAIKDLSSRIEILSSLCTLIDSSYFPVLYSEIGLVQDRFSMAICLSSLATQCPAYFKEALFILQEVDDESIKLIVLCNLAEVVNADFSLLFEMALKMQSKSYQLRTFKSMLKSKAIYLPSNESYLMQLFSYLVHNDDTVYDDYCEVHKAAQAVSDSPRLLTFLEETESYRTSHQNDPAIYNNFCEAVELARGELSKSLTSLADVESWKTPRQNEHLQLRSRSSSAISNEIDGDNDHDYSAEYHVSRIVEAACMIESDLDRAIFLKALEITDNVNLTVLRQVSLERYPYPIKAKILIGLTIVDFVFAPSVFMSTRLDDEEMAEISTSSQQINANAFSDRFTIIRLLLAKSVQGDSSHYHDISSPFKLSHNEWCKRLRSHAHRKRSDLMEDLAKLYPAILHLGGETAMQGVVDAMKEVCNQWK